MRVRGYMVEAELTDSTLVVEPTNKAAAVALRGQGHGDGPLVIARSEIARVEHKKANALVNGNLTVHTVGGQKYQLHFRKKSQDEFAALAAALSA